MIRVQLESFCGICGDLDFGCVIASFFLVFGCGGVSVFCVSGWVGSGGTGALANTPASHLINLSIKPLVFHSLIATIFMLPCSIVVPALLLFFFLSFSTQNSTNYQGSMVITLFQTQGSR